MVLNRSWSSSMPMIMKSWFRLKWWSRHWSLNSSSSGRRSCILSFPMGELLIFLKLLKLGGVILIPISKRRYPCLHSVPWWSRKELFPKTLKQWGWSKLPSAKRSQPMVRWSSANIKRFFLEPSYEEPWWTYFTIWRKSLIVKEPLKFWQIMKAKHQVDPRKTMTWPTGCFTYWNFRGAWSWVDSVDKLIP